MKLVTAMTAALLALPLSIMGQTQPTSAAGVAVKAHSSEKRWIEVSNGYTRQLLDIGLRHGPEGGSAQGLASFDSLISNPTLVDQHA